MNSCINLPVLGTYCTGDLTVQVAGYSLNLLHPGVIVSLVMLSVLCFFIFKSPT